MPKTAKAGMRKTILVIDKQTEEKREMKSGEREMSKLGIINLNFKKRNTIRFDDSKDVSTTSNVFSGKMNMSRNTSQVISEEMATFRPESRDS